MTVTEDIEITAWARLVRVSQALLAGVEADLKAAGLPPLAWYDVLLELDRAGQNGLRPQSLQDAMLLAQYNLSRLLDRMEREGLVRRVPCAEDRRGQMVQATEAGQAMRRHMWPVYQNAIKERFAQRLEPGQARALAEMLKRLG